MNDPVLLDVDPITGLETWWEYDPDTDIGRDIYIDRTWEARLDLNKAMVNEPDHFRGADNDLWHAASIPPGVQMKWLVEKGVDIWNKTHWPDVKKLLNDPEWRYLRTGNFRL